MALTCLAAQPLWIKAFYSQITKALLELARKNQVPPFQSRSVGRKLLTSVGHWTFLLPVGSPAECVIRALNSHLLLFGFTEDLCNVVTENRVWQWMWLLGPAVVLLMYLEGDIPLNFFLMSMYTSLFPKNMALQEHSSQWVLRVRCVWNCFDNSPVLVR